MQATLPAGATYSSGVLTLSGDGTGKSLDGWDFTGVPVRCDGANWTISGSKFGGIGVAVPLWVGANSAASCTVTRSDFNCAGIATSNAGCIELSGGSQLALTRVQIHDAPVNPIATLGGNLTMTFSWLGAPGKLAPIGTHTEHLHILGGTALLTNNRIDTDDANGLVPAAVVTDAIFLEAFAANITSATISNNLITGLASIGGNYVLAASSNGFSVSNTVWTNNLLSRGMGSYFYADAVPAGAVHLNNNFDYDTNARITIPAEIP